MHRLAGRGRTWQGSWGGHTSRKRLPRPLGGWLKSPHPLPLSAAEPRGGACCNAGEGTHLLHAKNNVGAQARRAVSLHAKLGVLLSFGAYGELRGRCFSFLGRRKGHVHLLSGWMRYNLQDHPVLAGLASFVRGWESAVTANTPFCTYCCTHPLCSTPTALATLQRPTPTCTQNLIPAQKRSM